MIITPELAQHIVGKIRQFVQENINIMDSSGVIIGSGQNTRLNTCHQGALDVIRSGETVQIFPEDINRFPGTMPGLNWPIVLDGQVVGVVGVSGHPQLVSNTAKLVKMVTELILERESLVEEFRGNLQLREQFIQLLLADRYQETAPQIAKTAKLLRFDLNLPRLVAVIHLGTIVEDAVSYYGTRNLVAARTRETLTQILDTSGLIDHHDLFVFVNEELIILKHFPIGTEVAAFCQWSLHIMKLLERGHHNQGLQVGLGSMTTTPDQLHESYQEALFAQKNNTSIYEFDTLVAYLVTQPGAIHCCLALKNLRAAVLSRLACKYDMSNTVNALLDNNLNITSAANTLFIHRNTMVFRLEKLKGLTGLCPRQSLNHALLCRILFSL